MNAVAIGDPFALLPHLPTESFLVIDDGEFIEQIKYEAFAFDVDSHTFDPLKDTTYPRPRHFVNVLGAVFKAGDSTLTRESGLAYILRRIIKDKIQSLPELIPPPDKKSTTGHQWAYDKIEELLLSPALSRVLLHKDNAVSFNRTIVARLNRAELGDFDCYLLGNLLISQFKGTVIIPDFGFYQCPFHTSLIRQNRLMVGIRSLDQVPTFKNELLLFPKKTPKHCTVKDAEELAPYMCPFVPDTEGYNAFIHSCTNGSNA